MKAILVMDMPENCMVCPLCNGNDECIMQDEDAIESCAEYKEIGAVEECREQADRTAPINN